MIPESQMAHCAPHTGEKSVAEQGWTGWARHGHWLQ